MNLTRILVAVNAPNGRDAAFERALMLARSSGAELYLLHAVPATQRFSSGAAERLERMTAMRQRAEEVESRADSRTARRPRRDHRAPCQRACSRPDRHGCRARPWLGPPALDGCRKSHSPDQLFRPW